VRLEDDFTEHPKLVAAGPLAGWLFVCGLTYCARHLTDGDIPAPQVPRLVVGGHKLAAALVAVGLWEATPAGYRVHDYLQYQPSRAAVLAARAKTLARVQRHRYAARNGVTDDVSNGVNNASPVPIPVPIPHASQHEQRGHEQAALDALDALAPGGAKTRSAGRRKSAASGPHHALFGALTERFGPPANQAEGGKLGKAAQLLLEAGVTPAEVPTLADACAARWGESACTPMALASNVSTLRRPTPTSSTGAERYFPDYRSEAEKAVNPTRRWRDTYVPNGEES